MKVVLTASVLVAFALKGVVRALLEADTAVFFSTGTARNRCH